ncbi:hypothetical protein GCM10018781_34720 [Kitasatospora indigofera]|uniref:Uncharacterized protein n=1 Tax=Kitasatospora indigofera TaxID=67307 RepID=A0A919FUJ5_9ACTN|nr:hypothetical protein GCM10018781_34720 [Kitasatospora indigofera]
MKDLAGRASCRTVQYGIGSNGEADPMTVSHHIRNPVHRKALAGLSEHQVGITVPPVPEVLDGLLQPRPDWGPEVFVLPVPLRRGDRQDHFGSNPWNCRPARPGNTPPPCPPPYARLCRECPPALGATKL